jgi:hypothetical protein
VTGMRRLIVLSAGVLACLASACTVDVTEEELLHRLFKCTTDSECVDGWECRSFALDVVAQQGYCVHPCTADGDCFSDQLCANEGFCMTSCDLADATDCGDPDLHCMRLDLAPGATAGYCQPTKPCDPDECPKDANQCLAGIVDALGGESYYDTTFSVCLQGCSGDSQCDGGFVCLKQALTDLEFPVEGVPEVCAPKCGENNACPNGFRCFLEVYTELQEAPAEARENEYKFCITEMPGSGLPCQDDHNCLAGRCVVHPDVTIGEVDPRPWQLCALPCSAEDPCASLKDECREVDHAGATESFCVPRVDVAPCSTTAQCTGTQTCMDFAHLQDEHLLLVETKTQYCAEPCSGYRDAACPAGTVCLPGLAEGASLYSYGCYVGLPGLPCAADVQCHQDFGEGTVCLGANGAAEAADRLCTKTCATHAGCTFGDVTGLAPSCDGAVCRPLFYTCNAADPKAYPDCSAAAGLSCAQVYSPTNQVCSTGCPGLRPEPSTCPEHFGCAPLPQGTGVLDLEYYCTPGYSMLIPCTQSAECYDPAGQAVCASPSGAPTVDGVCSVPCSADEDCLSILPEGLAANGYVLCMPAEAGAGGPGYCMSNPPVDILLRIEGGRQGTFCSADAPNGVPFPACNAETTCISATGRTLMVDDPTLNYCARSCQGNGECPQAPVVHDCVGTLGNRHCEPRVPNAVGRPYQAACVDHRQCEGGVCYRSSSSSAGFCTRRCRTLGTECAETGYEGSTCRLLGEAAGVCAP